MALNGFMIVFAPDTNQAANFFWDGAAQVAFDDVPTGDGAKFYLTKADARIDEGTLLQRYPNQEVAIVGATLTVAPHFTATPQVTAPAAPPAPAPAP
jgi:hypothetical protein